MTRLEVGDYSVEIAIRELVFPLLVLGFCTVYYVDTRNLPQESVLYAEPVLYVTLILTVAVLAVFGVSIDNGAEGTGGQKEGSMVGWIASEDQSPRRAVRILLLTMLYLLAMRMAFGVATAAFLAAALYSLGERRKWVIVTYAIGLTGLLYGVFILWLNIPL